MKPFFSLLLLACWAPSLFAQTILKTTNQKISSKAAAGTWIDYSVNPDEDQIAFTFQTKKTKKKSLYETYSFDMGLAYQGVNETELSAADVQSTYATLKPIPSDAKLLRVGKNLLTGQMKMELGKINYGYAGRALISTFETHMKVKPKGDDGNRLLLVHSKTREPMEFGISTKSFFGQARSGVTISGTTGSLWPVSLNVGDVQAFVYEKGAPVFCQYMYLVYDAKTLSRKMERRYTFDKSWIPIYVRDMPNGDMAFIFSTVTSKDYGAVGGMKSVKPHDQPGYKYLRIDREGKPVAEVDFSLERNKMGLPYQLSLIPASDPEDLSVYLLGYGDPDMLGMGLKELAASFAQPNGNRLPRMTNMTAKRLNTVVMGKFADNKLAYLHTMSPEAFWAKASPVTGSSFKVPTGKAAAAFFLSDLYVKDATTIDGKDFLFVSSAATGTMLTIQTNASGTLEHMYADQRAKTYVQEGAIFPVDGKIMVMFTHQPQGKTDSENRENNYSRSLEAYSIFPNKTETSSATNLLPKKHYVDLVNPVKVLENGEALILGHSSRKDLTISHIRW
ncbi:MAG: hypothetical protein AAFV07_02795 [Bacteroidota bacterium]